MLVDAPNGVVVAAGEGAPKGLADNEEEEADAAPNGVIGVVPPPPPPPKAVPPAPGVA